MVKKTLMSLPLALVGACLSSGVPETLDGTYTLRTVNGRVLPAVVSDSAGIKVELIDDAYVIDQTLNFIKTAHVRTTANGVSATSEQRSFGIVGSEGHFLKFRSSTGAPEVVGEYQSQSFAVVQTGTRYVYSK